MLQRQTKLHFIDLNANQGLEFELDILCLAFAEASSIYCFETRPLL